MKTGQDFNCLDLRRAKLADQGRLPAVPKPTCATARPASASSANSTPTSAALKRHCRFRCRRSADRVMLRSATGRQAAHGAVGRWPRRWRELRRRHAEFHLPAGKRRRQRAIRHVLHEPGPSTNIALPTRPSSRPCWRILAARSRRRSAGCST